MLDEKIKKTLVEQTVTETTRLHMGKLFNI